MVSAILVDGYLLKKKRDDRKKFLGSKYQKRYFELTSDTLAYAKDPRELKDGGGNIEVFAIHELKYIKKLDDGKLEMKFPERVLRVRAESSKDHERWYEAIKDARQKKLDGNNTPQAKQLETLKEHTKQQILTALEEDSDDDAPGQSSLGAPLAKKADTLVLPLSAVNQAPAPSNRPPSPRSLLANPRMGTMMIATPARNQQTEEEGSPIVQPLPKARSRWQDEEEADEAAAVQQAVGSRPGTTGSAASSGSASSKPSQRPTSERLQLNGDNVGQRSGGSAGAAGVPRGEKLQLGGDHTAGRLPSGTSAQPQQRSVPEPGQRLALGGPTSAAAAAASAGRGSRPGSGGEHPGAGHLRANGATAPAIAQPAAAATEGKYGEWEDDDWDSSDEEEGSGGGGGGQQHQQHRAAPAPGQSRGGSGSGHGARSGSGRPSGESGASGPSAARVFSGEGAAPRTAAPPSASGIRRSNDRPSGLPPPPPVAAGGGGGAGQRSKVPAPPPAGPARRQHVEDDEEGEGEAALAKHAAGTDHLDDNWDSDEEEGEEQQEPPPPPPKVRQQYAPPAPPAARPQAPPAARPQAPPAAAPQRRIPGPPPTAAPAASAPAGRPTTLPKPPAQAQQPVPPSPAAAGGRGQPGRSSHEGTVASPPQRGVGGSAGGRGQKLDWGQDEPQPGLKSNVVNNPNVKPDDNNWVEEDWDDDDD